MLFWVIRQIKLVTEFIFVTQTSTIIIYSFRFNLNRDYSLKLIRTKFDIVIIILTTKMREEVLDFFMVGV